MRSSKREDGMCAPRVCTCLRVVTLMQRCEPGGFNLLQVAKADMMKSW